METTENTPWLIIAISVYSDIGTRELIIWLFRSKPQLIFFYFINLIMHSTEMSLNLFSIPLGLTKCSVPSKV